MTALATHLPTPDLFASTPRRALGPAWHRQVGGLHVLKLKGSHREMGRQHGALLAREIPTGPIPYYREHLQRLVGRANLGPLGPLLLQGMRHTLGRRVAAAMPPFALDTIRGIAEGAGLPYEELLDGCTMPDALLWVVARMIQLKAPGPAVWHRLALGLGCTSALAWGEATRDGKLLHARNLDYHGVGNWPQHAAVVFHEPDEGQRYVSVAAAGVGLGGFTAMNEAGLSLTVHQHMFTDRTRLGGTPIGIVGDVVMREARTLDDAERILGAHDPIGCWTYLVADGKRGEVLCWEENPDRQVARRTAPADTSFGYANIYLDDALGATEQNLYGSYWRHNLGRHRRANELLAERAGTLDAQGMAEIIGDPGDPRCRVRDSIGMVMTVGSVVFRPEDGTLWVGTGEAPTSRGDYVPFSLAAEDHDPDAGALHVGRPEEAAADAAFERLRRAYIAYLDHDDPAAARRHLDEARAQAPEQALYHFGAGLLALVEGEAADAEERFDRAIALGHPDPERVAAFHLWRGRARDVAGDRAGAVADYRGALGRPADAPVHRAAKKGLGRAFTRARARKANLELSLIDCVAP